MSKSTCNPHPPFPSGINAGEIDPGPPMRPPTTSGFSFRSETSNATQNEPMTGTQAKHPVWMGNKRPAETTLERNEHTRRRSGSASKELEGHLIKALEVAQEMGLATPSTLALNVLTALTEYYHITTTPASHTDDLENIKQELASLKSMLMTPTTTPTPQPSNMDNKTLRGPSTSYATGPVIRPQKKTRAKLNPSRRNHPSRLVMEITDALDASQRPTPMAARERINAILQSSADTKDLSVVGIKFNAKGNCIAIAHPDTPVEKLITHVNRFASVVAGKSTVNAHPDTKWTQVVLNRVDTGQLFMGRPWTREELAEEFNRALSSEGITSMIGQPRWMAHADVLNTKRHASVVITLQSQEDADRLSQEIGGLMVFGKFAKTGRYTDKRPLRQCKYCWKYNHYQQMCKPENLSCRLCSGPHPEHAHKCGDCDKRDCQHIPLKCVNCGEAHPSDYAQCNARRAAIGSERMVPRTTAGGRKTTTKERTEETNDGMEL